MKKRKHFVSDDLVAVPEFDGPAYDDEGNEVKPDIIYIREKMSVAVRNKVIGSMFRMEKGNAEVGLEFDYGANQTALLENNVMRWEGPSFDGVPCIPETIGKLDPASPLTKKVLKEINERNQVQDSPDPKSSGVATSSKDGDTNGTVDVLILSEHMIQR